MLPMMAASIMADSPTVLHNVPQIGDVDTMAAILEGLGAKLHRERGGRSLIIDPSSMNSCAVDDKLMRQVRSSVFLLGPLLAKVGKARLSFPGGCAIGLRPIDLHQKGLEGLGARFDEEHGAVVGTRDKWEGVEIHLDLPSVGATENILMGACLAKGATVIRNAAKEPEIVDLQNFLNSMGARVRGAGTDVVRIEGVHELFGAEHTIMPDRIEVGTLMVAATVTRGDVLVENAVSEHVQAVTSKLREVGAKISVNGNGFGLRIRMKGRPKSTDLMTLPYPGYPTDVQPQAMALLALAEGTSVITETLFESRFRQAEELSRMGAKIRIEGRTAIIKGVSRLSGARVEASDLRSGASLVLAGLASEGTTFLEGICNIDRGYEKLEEKIQALGGNVRREP